MKGDLIMEKRMYLVDFQKEAKKRARKEKILNKINNAGNWINNNKDWIVIIAPAVIGLMTVGFKAVNKQINLSKEKDLKELYCYDRSLGHYWKLKRELSNSEWVEIDKRKKNGERLGDILDELKVLK